MAAGFGEISRGEAPSGRGFRTKRRGNRAALLHVLAGSSASLLQLRTARVPERLQKMALRRVALCRRGQGSFSAAAILSTTWRGHCARDAQSPSLHLAAVRATTFRAPPRSSGKHSEHEPSSRSEASHRSLHRGQTCLGPHQCGSLSSRQLVLCCEILQQLFTDVSSGKSQADC